MYFCTSSKNDQTIFRQEKIYNCISNCTNLLKTPLNLWHMNEMKIFVEKKFRKGNIR